jgi:hypothetical protein
MVPFFPNRRVLQDFSGGSLGARLETVKSACAIMANGNAFYTNDRNLERIKKLILPNPYASSFKYHMDRTSDEEQSVKVIQSTRIAQKKGVEVRWSEHFLFHSIVLADTDLDSGWVQVDSVLPYSETLSRPSYTIFKKDLNKTVKEAQYIFDALWNDAKKPREWHIVYDDSNRECFNTFEHHIYVHLLISASAVNISGIRGILESVDEFKEGRFSPIAFIGSSTFGWSHVDGASRYGTTDLIARARPYMLDILSTVKESGPEAISFECRPVIPHQFFAGLYRINIRVIDGDLNEERISLLVDYLRGNWRDLRVTQERVLNHS